MPIYARTSGGVYKVISKILTADGNEIGRVVDSTGRIIYEASRLITVTGVPPISFTKSIGKPLVSWDLLGNTQQTGTPSPDNIIMPTFCGARTAQLLDIKDGTQTINNVAWAAYHGTITAQGVTTAGSASDAVIVYDGKFTRGGNYINYCRIQASKSVKPPSGTYTFSANANPSDSSRIALIVGDNDGRFSDGTARKIAVGETFSVNGNEYIMLVLSSYANLNQYNFGNIMLNSGSTALPYEPYGYKIPFNNYGDNLFDKTATDTSNGYISSGFLNSNGKKQMNQRYCVSEYIPVSPNQSYTLLYGASAHAPSVCFYDSSKNFISGTPYNGKETVLFTAPQNAEFLRLSYALIDSEMVMLNTGSTPKPYSPYFSETVPVYLGQTQTARRIKKLVLSGTENWIESSDGNIYIALSPDKGVAWTPVLSTHFATAQVKTNGNILILVNAKVDFDTVEECKTYLAAQYAAGTPVTVWYVLATPETAIVNEPLAKIGDYADELHSTDAGVTIPTTKGNNTLTVDTDLLPSSMTIVYKGR